MKSSFSSTGKGYPVATICLMVGLAMLALAMQVNPAAAVTLDEAVDGQQLICKVLGSHPDVPVTRTTADGRSFVQVTCHGGLLDGATCDIVPGTDAGDAVTSTCYLASVAEDIHVAPSAGIEDVSDPGPRGAGNVAVDPVVAEDPTRGVPAQPGFSVDEIVKALTDGCGILGGADVEAARSGADIPPGSYGVWCLGGPRYDLRCTVAVESLTCQWLEPPVEPTADNVVTDVKVVGEAPTPIVAEQVDTPAPPTPTPEMDDDFGTDPTMPPTPTSVMDDDSGTAPTMPPTFIAPGNVGDNRAPTDGDIGEPSQNDPTPTAAPIL